MIDSDGENVANTRMALERAVGIFVDGIGTAAATSGILTSLQGRIFALLYLQPQPLSLDAIAAELEQSKSNVSVQIRGLLDWHLVRRVPIAGSRKDHYDAATDFWRLMLEMLERRYRFNVRQVLVAVEESERADADAKPPASAAARQRAAFISERLEALRAFFSVLDAGIAAFTQGTPLSPETLQNAQPKPGSRQRPRR
jgi:HTH-type transcriptional regulator, glycine betaine synthesis regulator